MIESIDNPLVKLVKKLSQKKYRDEMGLFVIEGPHLIEEALKSGSSIKNVLITIEKHKDLADKLVEQNISYDFISEQIMEIISDTLTPQGILAVVEKKQISLESITHKKPFLVICDAIQDPGNLGTIIRTAAAAGCSGMILSNDCVDLYNPKTIRSTGGNLFHIPIADDVDIKQYILQLKSNGVVVAGTTGSEGVSLYKCKLTGNLAVLIGNEGSGVKEQLLEICDIKLNIPMVSNVESINAAGAASIIIYEAYRQRHQ